MHPGKIFRILNIFDNNFRELLSYITKIES